MNNRELFVRLNQLPVGILAQNAQGQMHFSYDEKAVPISLGMPVRSENYAHTQCEAFFGGLLPESDQAKRAIGKQFGVSPNNSFALLKAIGYDCAGAISLHHTEEEILGEKIPLQGRVVSDEEFYQHLKALPQKPLFIGFDDLRLSLAGVHDKAAVCLINQKIALPEAGCPTTHIVKPNLSGFEGMVENEFFCLQLAGKIGLPVPHLQIQTVKDLKYLLIERYDRNIVNGYVERIHQEDFCQALGFASHQKYQNEGGPGFKACFQLLDKTTIPAKNRNLLIQVLVFNYFIGNNDAHSKNFSILHLGHEQYEMAPCYDLLCTRIYPELTAKMAMKIGSKYDANLVQARHWQQLCEEINYNFLALKRVMQQQGEKILNNLPVVKNEMEENVIVNKIVEFVKRQVEKTLEIINGSS
jgi:serine/threonine-protein kinase HipA